MGRLENHLISLYPCRVLAHPRACRVVLDNGGKSVDLALSAQPVIGLLQNPITIKNLVFGLRGSGFYFKDLITTLERLAQLEFINGGEALLEELNLLGEGEEFIESLANTDLIRIPLTQANSLAAAARPLGFLLFCLPLFRIWADFVDWPLFDGVVSFTQPIMVLGFSYMVFSAVLSVVNMLRWLMMFFLTGQVPALSLKISPVATYFEVRGGAFFDGKNELLHGLFLLALIGYMPFLIFKGLNYVDVGDSFQGVWFLATLVFIGLISPFSKSLVSDFFQLIYNGSKIGFKKYFRMFFFFYAIVWILVLTVFAIDNYFIFMEPNLVSIFLGFIYISVFLEIAENYGIYHSDFKLTSLMLGKRGFKLGDSVVTEDDNLDEILSKISFFEGLSEKIRGQMLKGARVVEVPKATSICRFGGKSRRMFVVLSGRVGVHLRNTLEQSKIIPLGKGAIFGEVTFFTGFPRTADVMSLEKTRLLVLSRNVEGNDIDVSSDEYKRLQSRIRMQQTLVSSKAFKGLPLEALDMLFACGETREFPIGVDITSVGEIGREFFIIQEGELDVFVNNYHVRIMKQGEFFGEIALILQVRRTATVRTRTACKLICISDDSFWNLLAQNLSFARLVEKVTFERLKATHGAVAPPSEEVTAAR